MGPVAVRTATEGDLAQVDALRDRARRAMAEGRGGPLLVEDLDGRAPGVGAAAAPAHRLLVGTIDGDVVGYASVVGEGRRARIPELWVHPAARQVGVGRALMAEIDETARGWGAEVLESQVLPGDRAAKNFFEAEGMVSRLLVVSRPVATDER